MAVKKNATTETKEVKTDVKETAPKAAKTTTKAAKAPRTTKKPAAAAADSVVIIEYGDKQVNLETVINDCKAHYKSLGHNTPKKLAVYVKPEEGVAYYTVNGKGSDDYKVSF